MSHQYFMKMIHMICHISITSMMPLYKLCDAIDDVIMARLNYVTVLNYVIIAKNGPFLQLWMPNLSLLFTVLIRAIL